MNLVLVVFAYLCCRRSMARATVPLNFNVFLEKAKLKDDGSNYTDWVRNLRIILIDAQKNYVLEAPLGARPAADATNATLRSETLRRNCVQCHNHKRWCKKTVKKGANHLRWTMHQTRFRVLLRVRSWAHS